MADLASYVEQAAEEFVKEDNPIVDGYLDEFFGDLKLSEKHAYAVIGLCEICFAQGMVKAMGDNGGKVLADIEKEKTCYSCGNKNCHIFYFSVKQDVAEHHETYEYAEFDCVNHNKWKEMKVEEIRTDNTETLKNALERIKELEKENAELKVTLTVGSTWNKTLNSMNKALEEERDKYRNMVFDKMDQLTKAKEIIEELYNIIPASMSDYAKEPMEHARKFMTEE